LTSIIRPTDAAALMKYLTPEEMAELDRLLGEDIQDAFWRPLPGPQAQAFNSTADVIGYGGAAGSGKALALDTPIPTPDGWTNMGDLRVGDTVFDERGEPCLVTFVSEIQHRPCYRMVFDNGDEIITTDEHRWLTFTAGDASVKAVRTTEEIAKTVRTAAGSPNHSIPVAGQLRVAPPRKLERLPTSAQFHYITACDLVPTVPARCIAVDSPSHLYLAGRSMIPTHNTDLALGKALMQHHHVLIMRRESTQLQGAIERLAQLLGGDRSGFNSQNKIWRNAGPRKVQIEFGSAPNAGDGVTPGDEARYQGRAHDLLVIDEATGFAESQIRYLQGWVRSTIPGVHSQTLMTFNPPTGEGRWIIDYFGPWLKPNHPFAKAPGEIAYVASIPDGNGGSKDVWDVDERPFVLDGTRRVYDFDPRQHRPEDIITPSTRVFIPARISDNPYLLNSGYLRQLQAMPEPLRSQLLYGKFDTEVQDDPYQLIPTAWVDAAMARWKPMDRKPPMESMGIDVARGGKDFTVLARLHEGGWFDELVRVPGSSTPNGPSVAGLVVAHMRDGAPLHVDAIGVGASVVDFLDQSRLPVIGVNVSNSATATDKSGLLRFSNLRTQLWWKFREALDPSNNTPVALPPDEELRAELCTPVFMPEGRTLRMSSRDDIIERIGRSPDAATAVILAWMRTPKLAALTRAAGGMAAAPPYDPYARVRT
jgi:hypothetical protein